MFSEIAPLVLDGPSSQAYVAYMPDLNFDQLLIEYNHAIDAWVAAIRNEESLAKSDHSMVAMELWDAAGLAVHDAELAAKKARDHYKNAMRRKNYGF